MRFPAVTFTSLLLLTSLPVQAAPSTHGPGALRVAEASGRGIATHRDLPLVLTLKQAPSAAVVRELEELGATIDESFDSGSITGKIAQRTRRLSATVPRSKLGQLLASPLIERAEFDGHPFEAPRPLNHTQELISVDDVHRTLGSTGLALTGKGITICDSDTGVDVLHPMFFRPDLGFYDFSDENDNGFFDPAVDSIRWGGVDVVLRSLNGVVIDRGSGQPLFGSEGSSIDFSYDYVYADLNGDGIRNAGVEAGFTEATPTYGEPLFIADDVNGDGELQQGERLVALGSSKVKAFRYDGETYERGKNLIEAPCDDEMQHGTGASGVLLGGQLGFGRLVGMAPDADLVMAAERGGGREYAMTNFCINRGARVVLHEYAPWQGYHLDGSSDLEQLIDESSLEGVVHINPAGNLSTSQKLMRRTLDASGTTTLPIAVPAINATFFGTTLLWLDASRDLSFRIESPSGAALDIGTGQSLVQTAIDGKTLYAFREDSPRGTAKLDIYIFDESVPTSVTPGDWRVIVSDTSALAPIELIGSVQDEVSGWGLGAHFTEHVTEDHLVGWPGTADRGLAVSAYVGHGDFPYAAGEEGARAYYSGRGHRIDGSPLMWISAPDNPIVPGRFSDQELGYLIYGGTSGASPHVAGSAALMLENDPSLDGDGVKAMIKAGAAIDAFTGAVPNDDFGWGKLDTYRSIFGRSAPDGTAPELSSQEITVEVGPSSVPLSVVDKEDEVESLRLEADLDYDGVFDQELAASPTPELELNYDAPGSHVIKLRASDPTGRTGQALLRVSVVAPEPEPEPEPVLDPAFYPAGGCRVVSSESSSNGLLVAGLAVAAALAARRRRNRLRPS